MPEAQQYVQLQMVWPAHRRAAPPWPPVPTGYRLRAQRAGDEAAFFRLMELAGWPGWNEEKIAPLRARFIPGCWFVVDAPDQPVVATAMGLTSASELHPGGAELGWVAAHPDHRGKGLGLAVCAAVTRALLQLGFADIYLLTDDWRLPALKTYLKLGYEPFLFLPQMRERWQAICSKLSWPFTPEVWPSLQAPMPAS